MAHINPTRRFVSCTTILIGWFLSLLAFTGCIEKVDLQEELGETKKLVLYCQLCPQLDTTYILLSHTRLLFGAASHEAIQIFNDGVVELSADGKNWVQASFDSTYNRYRLTRTEFPIEEGHTYHIRASHEGYKEVSATCTVPWVRDVDFRIDTVRTEHDTHWGEVFDYPHIDLYAQWRDWPGEANYYGLVMLQRSYDYLEDGVDHYSWVYKVFSFTDEEGQWYQYVADEGRDGQPIRMSFAELLGEEDLVDGPFTGKEIYLCFLDRENYLFDLSSNASNDFINFLLLEPGHTYSNITNGFGLFGAFCLMPLQ